MCTSIGFSVTTWVKSKLVRKTSRQLKAPLCLLKHIIRVECIASMKNGQYRVSSRVCNECRVEHRHRASNLRLEILLEHHWECRVKSNEQSRVEQTRLCRASAKLALSGTVPHKADIASYNIIAHDVISKIRWSFRIGRAWWGLVGVRPRVITSASSQADYINYTNVSRDLPVPSPGFTHWSPAPLPVLPRAYPVAWELTVAI